MQPCTKLKVVGKLIGREPSDFSKHQIMLIFAPEVEVTKSVLTTTGINLMSNLGGSLGLMLGLGILQIAELLDRGLNSLLTRYKENKKSKQSPTD